MKKSIIEIGVLILLAAIVIILSILLFNSCSDKKTLEQSNSALYLQYKDSTSMLKKFRTISGLSAVSIKIIQASKTDLKKGDGSEVSQMQSAGVNSNEITSIGVINAHINIDSLKWSYQTKIDSLKNKTICANYTDSIFQESLCFNSDSILSHSIRCKVPIIWATSSIRKKIWFITLPKWLFGIKERRYTVISTSKYVDITGAEYIEKR